MIIYEIIDGKELLFIKDAGGLMHVNTDKGIMFITPEQYWYERAKEVMMDRGVPAKMLEDFAEITKAHITRMLEDERMYISPQKLSLN